MGLTFTKAPEVAPEQPITSAQYRKLARAFNDRLRSGVGDPTFRIQQYWFNLFRQVRNPAEGGLVFPAQGEFFELYQLLDPEQSQATWPVTGPGEYEGANLGNPMMQFVFGNPVMEREDQMLGEPYFYFRADTLEPQTPYDWWVVGKVQRGTIDIVQNKTCMPALVGAQRALSITSFQYSPHGRSYGGFFPTPIQLLPNCGTTEATGHGIASYQLKFSALRADVNTTGLHGSVGSVDGKPVVTYAGTCPPDADHFGTGHVAVFGKFPYAYYLLVWDGSQFHVVRLPTSDWIEGPYDSRERLSRPEGGQLLRALNAFAADFRGSDRQRAEPDFVIEDLAFPFQEFFTTQYYLAPNFGITVADTGNCLGDTAPFCPVVLFTGQTQWPAGTVGKFWHDRSPAYTYHEGFVLGGMIAVAEYLAEPVTLEILDGTELIALLQLTPEEPQMMRWLRDCPTPKLLRVRLISELKLTNAAGGLFVEFTEQLRMLPEIWDAYFVLRTSATGGGDAYGVGVDGRGKDRENSRQLGDNYFRFGCVMNPQASSLRDIAEWVNDNPVYDAARRLSREHMRILSRRQFLTYEVTGGKSILRFKRYAYGMNHSRADCFYGIAPPYDPIPSGQLLAGETYIIRGAGSIQYDNRTLHPGQRFTASATREYQAHGSAAVHVYDGIRHHAPKSGVTNEWLMFLQTKCYHPSESSIWKPEAYADYFTWNNRCHFYTGDPPKTGSTIAHLTYNVGTTLTGEDYRPAITPPRVQASFIAPEAPSGYNYVNNANSTYLEEDFYKSCRIYEPDAEIESCTIEFVQGEEIVVLTFKGRLHSHPTAPATVHRDPLAWSETERDDLWAESFRTPDNALREYALHQARGDYQCSRKIGDAGMVSSVFFLPDNPFGSCYPHFFFTRLVPEPYEDNNEQAEATDTRATVDAFIQMETYLRAMCEGFVDGQTSVANICAGHEASLYDYTYENLCFEAFGGRWINSFAQAARPDNPSGFGPLPNTLMYAEVFNRLARSVNLLTRARVSIPWKIETTIRDYHGGPRPVTTTIPSDGSACDTGNSRAMCRGQAPPADQFVSSTHFPEGSAIGAFTACGFAGSCGPELEFQLFTLRQTCEYKMVANPTLTGYIEAIPPALRGLIDAAQTGFIGVQSHTTTHTRIKGQYPADSESPEYTHCNHPFPTIALFDNGNCSDPESPACLYYGHESVSQVTSFCSLFHSDVLDTGGAPPDSEYWVYYHVDQQCGGGAEYSISIAPVDLNTTGFVVVPLAE